MFQSGTSPAIYFCQIAIKRAKNSLNTRQNASGPDLAKYSRANATASLTASAKASHLEQITDGQGGRKWAKGC
jgi:hypothetical protein